jgi:NAD(P)-dependent dehydrogenase (short-subunit alcohol dehydrogenase family)
VHSAQRGGFACKPEVDLGRILHTQRLFDERAKHWVVGLMRAFAVELGQHFIRGELRSAHQREHADVHERGNDEAVPARSGQPRDPDDLKVAAQFMHVLPVGWVEPVDISNAVLFLASDESRYITGLPVTVDAGSMLK